MYIYKLTSDLDGYETYDSMVVVAKNEHEARLMHPSGDKVSWDGKAWMERYEFMDSINFYEDFSWISPKDLTVEYVGISFDSYQTNQVLVASFNAA